MKVFWGPQGQDFLAALGQNLSELVGELKTALARLQETANPDIELAADFAQAFLGDRRTSAPPYVSVYLSTDGLLFQQPHDEMAALLKADGQAVEEAFREPCDHLAIMLDYLGNQILRLTQEIRDTERRALYNQQLAFIEQRLLNWVPAFSEDCQKIGSTGFYPAAARLLDRFLRHEQTYLQEELGLSV